MIIMGVDFHPEFQQIASVDTDSGEIEERRLQHAEEARCEELVEGKATTSDEIRKRIVEIGIRKVAREAGLHTDTVTLIARGSPVKASTLQPVVKYIQEKEQRAG